MKRLALDTTGDACSVALDVDGDRYQRLQRDGRQHSRSLPQMMAALLLDAGIDISALDAILCCVGPGGFAGVRVGVAYAKGLALGLEIPVAPVSSLALLARGAVRRHDAQQVLTAIDARMGEVYVAEYRRGADGALTHLGERVCAPDAVQFDVRPDIAPCVATGSGWQRYGDILRDACANPPTLIDMDAVPQAVDAFDLVSGDHDDDFVAAAALTPSYLRNQVALTLAERRNTATNAARPSS